jgi:hypothetical protein
MISTSALSTALAAEHSADLRRQAMRTAVAGRKPANRRLRLIAAVALTAGVALFASAPAWAGTPTVYASPTGSTTAACTDPAEPCQLQRAIDQAPAGSELVLAPGTYTSSYPVQVSKVLDIHGEDGQPAPTIVNDHSGCTPADFFCLGSAALRLGGASGSFRHARVLSTGDQGNSADTIEAYNPADSGRETIEDVYAESLDGVAIYTQGDVLARDTVAWSPSSPFAAFEAAAPPLNAPQAQVRLENVTAVGGPNAYGLWLFASCVGNGCGAIVTSENSILRGGKSDIWPEAQFNGEFEVDASHSNYDIGTNIYVTASDQNGNQTPEPQFVDAANGDFHQLESSPTRDAGIASADLGPVDLDGGARTYGSAPDIGADEWTPTPPSQQPQQPQQPGQPQGGQPSGPSGAHSGSAFHGVRLSGGKLRLRHGKLRLRVSCPLQAAGYCKGLLSLTRVAHSSKAGRASFTLKPGHTKRVSVSVPRKLRKLRRFSALATAVASDSAGNSFASHARVRVHRG